MALPQNIKHKEVIRSTLFYNRYRHRIVFMLPYAAVINFSHSESDIAKNIKNGMRYYQTVQPTPDEISNLKTLLSFVLRHNPGRRGTVDSLVSLCGNEVRVFTNSDEVIDELLVFAKGWINHQTVNNDGLDPEEMVFASDPPHAYRTYLRSRRVDASWKKDFHDFLVAHPDLRPCDGLMRWLQLKNAHIGGSYHVGYDLPQSRMIIQLFLDSKYVGKHYRCVKRPEINKP